MEEVDLLVIWDRFYISCLLLLDWLYPYWWVLIRSKTRLHFRHFIPFYIYILSRAVKIESNSQRKMTRRQLLAINIIFRVNIHLCIKSINLVKSFKLTCESCSQEYICDFLNTLQIFRGNLNFIANLTHESWLLVIVWEYSQKKNIIYLLVGQQTPTTIFLCNNFIETNASTSICNVSWVI